MIKKINFTSAEKLLKEIKSKVKKVVPPNLMLPIVLYGAGNLGRMAIEYLEYIDASFEFILDRDVENLKADEFWSKFPIYQVSGPPEYQKSEALVLVCVTNFPFYEILQKLNALGWKNVMTFYDFAECFRDIHPLSNGWRMKNLSEEDWANTKKCLDEWGDNISRAHHLQFMAWRRLREDWLFEDAHIDIHNRFFIPEVVSLMCENERFLDVGAHVGTVLNRFIEIRHGKFEKIWAIEPDEINIDGLRERVKGLPKSLRDRIDVIPIAASNLSTCKKFKGGLGYASQFCNLGMYIKTTTIDALNLAPTFIKFHLEGAELDALEGSISTINKNRPTIVATCYHGEEGIHSLPSWFRENLDDYLLLFRLHGWCGCGAVIYAIPNEKILNYEKK